MTHDLAVVLLAAGATFVVVFGGMWGRDVLARRRPSDVFDYIERGHLPPRSLDTLQEISRALDQGRRDRRELRALLRRDALARQRGENIDGSPRRETRAAPRPPRGLPDIVTPDPVLAILGCPACRTLSECSTPAVCRAVDRLFPNN